MGASGSGIRDGSLLVSGVLLRRPIPDTPDLRVYLAMRNVPTMAATMSTTKMMMATTHRI